MAGKVGGSHSKQDATDGEELPETPLVIRTIFVQRLSGNGEEIAASPRSKRSLVYSTVARASVVQPRTPWLVIE